MDDQQGNIPEVTGWPASFGADGLDEALWRSDGWNSFRSCVLNGGQTWHFPRIGPTEALMMPDLSARLALFPVFEDEDLGSIGYWDDRFRFEAMLRPIAARLLTLNYQISEADALDLVSGLLWHQDDFNLAITDILVDAQGRGVILPAVDHDRCLFAN